MRNLLKRTKRVEMRALCFIDECGVVHDTIRIYEYKAVRSKEIPTDSRCVMCGEIIPEGSMVCDRCREAVEGFE